ncbi:MULTISPECIES: dipeptidase PepV [Brevibacillus]|jgi:succinyl-diaminopimelate desuccinylase|uniref:Dipeptidase PepV n=1 Tax=Brevibacillus thermoruber TaxID=33942 RepID=A0A9X3Z448_9BACL|nr:MULTISPECIES: dipeptidase PepV [Brevibacillus]MDA5109517.1 dipeptidase PepV [Brevibacillus thermoruber]TRY27050.1 dipeptidase PepV [Brevibacillus sp. LEMMJ03]
MTSVNWLEETEKRKDELLAAVREFLQIKSVLDPATARDGAPFGEGIRRALDYALKVCADAGMTVKDVGGYAAHAEFGEGEELIGILSHVDVVPEGDGWSSPPYAAEIVDGKIVARGAIDDKGPAMAAIFAAKIVKELGLPLSKRVRLIFGTDEESNWQCVKTYFQTEEMPTMGFTPDADFPLIYAEKGLTDLTLTQTADAYAAQQRPPAARPDAKLLALSAGLRMNMVPDKAEATLEPLAMTGEELAERYRAYLRDTGLSGEADVRGGQVLLRMEGVSVHAMDPSKGVNAGTELLHFLAGLTLDERGRQFARFTDRYLHRQHYGEAIGIAHDDEEMGPLTLNTGVIRYEADGDAVFGVNIRYPHSQPFERWRAILEERLAEAAFSLEVVEHLKPHRVDPQHPLVTTLQRVYTEQTGQEAEIIAIGGATYGRSLEVGVAFGPLFPGRPDSAHQRDEHIRVDDLIKATAIYAQAIYELAK